MAYRIEFSRTADRVLRKLDKPVAKRILDALEEISHLDDPRSQGKALTGNLARLWSYRAGEYRIICAIDSGRLAVFVVDLGHRREIYQRLSF
ncbi:type II toxin-antitoxin system RelE family toxin [Mobiluncus mulieris]|uniref:Type II toxin-antitoxin system RelE/ParE family toxin n=1 Tax=Mobiluncus mulieris TaxID=2052 RepID=A0A378P9S2_9ACTO|nr:type II toxin-antitoxin system RelE/ParE family toxin [Mobiluncus mulieris]MCU9969331.1 type II toxin-antitoxin system RelE/ParE family toxin [Mobiluncus mulieris]MCU9973402.1 type II toxin-antitoxin system RelE/ParE family toxin [Mobiluncus mulieris]MCV0008922.1 type II toxin-antitoxin system RelE/ParE family toxin [Mobiluncus mulieris]NMW65442.1 type II toxin-antitoxin system RelE/ParE family toxin [Mobiluncus mulieris]NMW74650.1 type II toxin-antitoxin system RelE/ParE family toxin [Mobi